MNSPRLITAVLAGTFGVGLAAETSFKLPPETAKLKPARDVVLATSKCLLCHSVDYISMQPSFTETVWRGIVIKMRDRFGAPIATNEVERLVRYFSENYGAKETK